MIVNLKQRCKETNEREFYYGAKLNKDVKDAYLGFGYLEPNEKNKKISPGKGHEEILMVLNGSLRAQFESDEITITDGDAFHIPDRSHVILENLTSKRVTFVIAGGHTKKLFHRH